jgi:hypothetical protein
MAISFEKGGTRLYLVSADDLHERDMIFDRSSNTDKE